MANFAQYYDVIMAGSTAENKQFHGTAWAAVQPLRPDSILFQGGYKHTTGLDKVSSCKLLDHVLKKDNAVFTVSSIFCTVYIL